MLYGRSPENLPLKVRIRRWWKGFKSRKREMGLRYALTYVIPYSWRRRVSDFYWGIRHRTINRFNIIRIPTLRPDYWEFNTRMLHGMFALLVDFVEKTDAYKHFPNFTERDRKAKKTIEELYNWWKNIHPHRDDHDPFNHYMDFKIGKAGAPTIPLLDIDGDPYAYKYDYGEKFLCVEDAANTISRESNHYEVNCQQEDIQMMCKLCSVSPYLCT